MAYFTLTADLTSVANSIASEDPADVAAFLADLATALGPERMVDLSVAVGEYAEDHQQTALGALALAIAVVK